ncbi:hypothetical protein K435DRAFT_802610 [Dendrothele bispora CBS 962.96]|uniref:Uncharacterized protein n=1 Tax=Dendrothele bispora (strain CBS 962.96) TaxID=1314807 RepID=A0A4S8LK86_DENBC|nr:hypothetical protein K435DRAFT_803646 [Dendrothele bispora CBS 962.96]THU89599.1 hypothetical protein K435DRAFT_802610 [Dendrothele bispora CBS 962.96]
MNRNAESFSSSVPSPELLKNVGEVFEGKVELLQNILRQFDTLEKLLLPGLPSLAKHVNVELVTAEELLQGNFYTDYGATPNFDTSESSTTNRIYAGDPITIMVAERNALQNAHDLLFNLVKAYDSRNDTPLFNPPYLHGHRLMSEGDVS